MPCCSQCEGIETVFNRRYADRDLREYHKHGPTKQTCLMLDTLLQNGIEGLSLLDIGGGIGAIQHELFGRGIRSATDVDASSAYLAVAREEAARRGNADRTTYLHGNFVELAPDIKSADIVTLDRVICCYSDMDAMVTLSSARADKLYALVYPRDTWWMRIGGRIGNLFMALTRNQFRFFVHPAKRVDAIIRGNGLQPHLLRSAGIIWQVAIYQRT